MNRRQIVKSIAGLLAVFSLPAMAKKITNIQQLYFDPKRAIHMQFPLTEDLDATNYKQAMQHLARSAHEYVPAHILLDIFYYSSRRTKANPLAPGPIMGWSYNPEHQESGTRVIIFVIEGTPYTKQMVNIFQHTRELIRDLSTKNYVM